MTAFNDVLKLDRNLTNTSFGSWRLGAEAVQHKRVIQLPHAAFELRSDAIDFLHTRSSVLHNSLCVSQGRIFTFLEGDGSSLLLSEVKDYYDTQKCEVKLVSVMTQADDQPAGPAIEQVLEPSISVITPSDHEDQYQALVSSGRGDLRLLTASSDDAAASTISDAVFPLRPTAPLTGRRPFILEQAYQTPAGSICCVAWAVRSSSPGKVACAEVYSITLSSKQELGMQPQLSVDDVQLLRRCALPPYAVLCDPSSSRVLLAVDPTTIDDEVEHVECRTGQQAGAAMPTDDGDEVDPRTLAEAAARLAKFSAQDAPPGPLPHQQWADIYKESGPDGLGAMGSEPGCDLLLLQLQERQASSSAAGSTEGSAQVSQLQAVTCGAFRVLSAESKTLDSAVMGLTDDVDCALVQLGLEPAGLVARHVASVPALAYIAAGKVQRKHLLLGAPSSSISAVLVEGQRYLYVYTATPVSEQYGQQQVVDMELDRNEAVLGARLLPGGATSVLLVLTQQRLLCYQLA